MALDTGGSRRWWDEERLDRNGPDGWDPDDGIDDGLEVFVATATGARAPRAALDGDGGSGERSAERGRRASPLRHFAELATSLGARQGLLLLAGSVVAVGLLIALLAGGGGPPVDPALPIAGQSAADPRTGAPEGATTIDVGNPEAAASVAAGAGDGTDGGGGGDAEVVIVHVAGAVASPGVHLLPVGSRVHDAIAVAGGARPEADLDRLNLAAPVVDGTQVYVAAIGATGGGGAGTPSGDGAGGGVSVGGPVSLSTADAAALDALPGVGPSTAAAIIAHREANGPFGSVEDLLEVRGIGAAKLEGLRELVVP